jgi:hypothetical protein
MSELSPTTRALLRAAREDGPSAAGRAHIWSGVAASAAGGTVLGAAGAKAGAAAGTAKLFVMGALLGSAVTVGVAAMVLQIGTPRPKPDAALAVHADPQALAPAAGPATLATPAAEEATRGESSVSFGSLSPVAPLAAPRTESGKRAAGHARAVDDALNREAQLVAEARGAVVRGYPEAALSALHAAKALPAHAMEPEELSLEVRALRALGRLDEANATDARLHARFPDHALAR